MALVVSGLLNKQIALELGISEITVKAHRGQVMRKMRVQSLAELVRVAAALDVPLVAHASYQSIDLHHRAIDRGHAPAYLRTVITHRLERHST